jgi:hypothetical protein
LGPLADPSKEAHESSLPENNKKDNEEEKPPQQKHVKFKFSSMEVLHHLMLAFTHHWPHFRLILRPVTFLRQGQKGERKMKTFP